MPQTPPPLALTLPDDADLDAALAGLVEGLAASPVPVLLTEADLDRPGPRIVYANLALRKQTGYTEAELLAATPRLLQGPLTDRGVLDRLKADLRAGRPFAGTTANYKKDGTPYPVAWSILPVRHRGRTVRYLSHQAATDPADVAGLALLARAQLAEWRFDRAVTACGLGFWDHDLQDGALYLSPGWKAQAGYADADLPNDLTTVRRLLHPDDAGRVWAAYDRFVTGADPGYRVEFRLRHRAGDWVWVESRGSAVRGADGRATRVVGTHTDVTARKRAEEAVRASEARLRTLLTHCRDIVSVVAPDGRRLFVSDAYHRQTGYPPGDLAGTSLLARTHPDDQPAVAAALTRMMAAPAEEVPTEFRYRMADGRYVPIEATGVNLTDVPAVGGILLSARDVSDRKRLEEQLRQAHKLEALGTLAGGVAHDFNNLLTVIVGNLDLLGPPAGDADRLLLDQVRAAVARAQSLTESLLGFARREPPTAPTPVAVGPLLAATADILRRVLDKRIVVRTDLPAGLPAALADPGTVEQAVLNLALNARDAMPAGGTLAIGAAVTTVAVPPPVARPGRYVAVTVADTGTGIPADVLPRVFEPFFTTKPKGKGSGLGLAAVADAARRLGGWIDLQSEVGAGTRATLYLPAAADPLPPVPPPPPAETGVGRVLVIDDEDLVRRLVAAVLGRAGYAVDTAADGPAGLEAYRANRPDLVLLDLTLPGRPGEAVLRELLAHDPTARVLVVSGLLVGRPPAGAVGGLPKPFTSDKLLAAVRAAVEPRRVSPEQGGGRDGEPG
jgi:PAS domain S-box-containing protein